MKNFKKILALVLAAIMLAAMMVPAIAEDPTYDTPVTITGLEQNDTVVFYQVLEWVGGDAAGNVAGWKAKAPFDSILDQAKLTEVLIGIKAQDAVTDPTTGDVITPAVAAKAPGITAELAGQLARLNLTSATKSDTITTVKTNSDLDSKDYKAVYNNTGAGLWMALVTPADVNTIYNPVFVSADFDDGHEGDVAVNTSATYSDTAAAKKSTLTLTKTAANANDYNNDNAQTTAVDDIVTYTVTTTIPGYGKVYTNPKFVLSDKLTNLTLQKKGDTEDWDITVTGVDAANYTIEATTTSYKITFKPSWLITNNAPQDITVVYKAKVDKTTATQDKAINEEDNDVMIEYSHTPTNESDYDVKKDTTQHYTFTLDAAGMGWGQNQQGIKTSELVKTGVDAAGNPIIQKTETSAITDTESWEGPLEGAQFGLWDADHETCENVNDAIRTASTGIDGRMTFAGLDAGTYYIREIQAPSGYVTNPTVHKIDIEATFDTVKVTEWYDATNDTWVSTDNGGKSATYDTEILASYTVTIDKGTADEHTAAHYTFENESTSNSNEIKWTTVEPVEHPYEFPNVQGVELPSTGGIGTTIFYVGGGLLVLLAAVLLVTKRRMSAND